ncbi:MAG TPA: hypothetical protein VG056_13025, partial [Pirellulales bacterium]|nr:hypothetical protein [Pirellulales bacterium]
WKVRPAYQFTTYTRRRYSALNAGDSYRQPPWPWRLLIERWSDHRRSQRAAAFARDTAALFGEIAIEPGDQVFIPTLSELDLLGLAQYLAHDDRTRRVDWHLQFHYPIFTGCEPDYLSQDARAEPLRRIYNQAVTLAAGHRLHFYTTSDHLTAQQNRLGVAPFQTLPYPVNPILQTGRDQSAERNGPLRIAYLGDARREKGYQLLPGLIQRLWRDYVATDQARFVVQSNFHFPLPARGDDLEVVESVAALRRLPQDKIALVDEPVESEEFCRRTLATDIGLLLYDRRAYFSRCSGVLVELLSAGVPVLVSAGCWMADQLADATRDYHTSLRHNRRVLGTGRPLPLHSRRSILPLLLGKVQPAVSLPNGGEGAQVTSAQLAIPAGASDLLLFFLWPNDLGGSAGAYGRVETSLFSANGAPLDRWATVIGPGSKGRWSTGLVRLPPNAATVAVDWQNAYGRQPVEFSDVELCFLAPDSGNRRPTPRGAVGLIAAHPEQAPELLIDLIENYSHYRQTAAQFAGHWTAWHNPDRVVAELLSQRRTLPLPATSSPGAVRSLRA